MKVANESTNVPNRLHLVQGEEPREAAVELEHSVSRLSPVADARRAPRLRGEEPRLRGEEPGNKEPGTEEEQGSWSS